MGVINKPPCINPFEDSEILVRDPRGSARPGPLAVALARSKLPRSHPLINFRKPRRHFGRAFSLDRTVLALELARFRPPRLDFRGQKSCFFDARACVRSRAANMLPLCFGPIKIDVSCTSALSRDTTRATQNRSKIALRAFRQAFSLRSREKLAPNALKSVLGTSWGFLGASHVVLGTSRERPGTVPSASERVPKRPRSAPSDPGSPKIAPRALRSDFYSIFASPGSSRERPRAVPGAILA